MMSFRARLVVYSLMLAGSASVCTAQTVTEDRKITASDAASGDEFGLSVAISGTTAIVGAYGDDDAGSSSGSAYLFDTTTGQQLFKLTASDASATDFFGWSVAISGITAIVGAIFGENGGNASGSAYLFDTTTGQQLIKLTASDAAASDYFGRSVAICGTTAIVGATLDDDGGGDSGSAYLFDTTTGQQLFKLTASDASATDYFGWSVAISGTTAVVGAPFDDDGGSSSGSAYLFDTTTGQQLFKLTASDAAASDNFGWSVAISGTTAIVGALFDDDGGNNSGSAYLFDTTTGQQLFKLTAPDATSSDTFGYSVAICGTNAIVGASADDSASVFDATTGVFVSKLTASDSVRGDAFGSSVATAGSTAIVGAYFDNDAGSDSGSAYIFLFCRPDMNNDGLLDFFDLSSFLTAFSQESVAADFNNDGQWDFFDLSRFIIDFGRGCP